MERRADKADGRARRVFLTRAGAKLVDRDPSRASRRWSWRFSTGSPILRLEQAQETLRTLKETLLEMLGANVEEADDVEINNLV